MDLDVVELSAQLNCLTVVNYHFKSNITIHTVSSRSRHTTTGLVLRHAVGTSIAKPPNYGSYCKDPSCTCGRKTSWFSDFCHHAKIAFSAAKKMKCQDGRFCKGKGLASTGCHCIIGGCASMMGLALACSRCNSHAYGREFEDKTNLKTWLRIEDISAIFFAATIRGVSYRVYQFWDWRLVFRNLHGKDSAAVSESAAPPGVQDPEAQILISQLYRYDSYYIDHAFDRSHLSRSLLNML